MLQYFLSLPNQKRLDNITEYELRLQTQQHLNTILLIGSSFTESYQKLDYSNHTLENIPDNYFKGLNFYRVIKVDS